VIAPTTGAAGNGLTSCTFEELAVPHEPPVVVSVNVVVPLYVPGGVHVVFRVVAFGLKVPPAGVDQIPPVAEPPTLPPNAADVPPWHIALTAAPAFAVGKGLIAIIALPVCGRVVLASCTLTREYVYVPAVPVDTETVTLFPEVVVTI